MRIVFHKNFVKKLKKLDPKIKVAFKKKVVMFRVNRFDKILNNHSFDRTHLGCRSINITGNYRIIFRDFGELIYFISDVERAK